MILISLNDPFTEHVPVAPDPTLSVIETIGGLITSYFSPPLTTFMFFNSP